MADKKILIVSGEPSGDLHASNLIKDMKSLEPNLRFFGLGGSLSEKEGVEILFNISKLALVGVTDVVKNIFTVKKAYGAVIKKINAEKPDLAILVDYPGFNLALARELKKRDIPVVYYISPQIWAWGRQRVGIIKKCVRKIIVFFKFEEELYKTYGIDAEFVGHPLLDTVKTTLSKDDFLKKYDLSPNRTTIAVLPGSRESEVGEFLLTMLRSCNLIKEKLPNIQIVISKHPDLPVSLYEEAIRNSKPYHFKLITNDTYNMLNAADFAIVASGTATLESAIMGTPLAVVYRSNLITFLLYKMVRTVRFLGLVNIIANKEVAPELLQYDMTPENIASKVTAIISDGKKMSEIRGELKAIKLSLGSPGASSRAAAAILTLLK